MASVKYSEPVTARIWEPIEPLDRGDRYEDPLQEILARHGLGQITGGGSQLSEHFEILFADIELQLANRDEALEVTRQALEELGAPAGSELLLGGEGEEVAVPFGASQGVAVYLDGVSLPQEVYDTSDINELADQLTEALAEHHAGEIRGSWAGPQETAIYLYGQDAERLYATIEPVLRGYPLCQNARVVLRWGNPKLGQREIRLPRHA
jgi:hypothetical protein